MAKAKRKDADGVNAVGLAPIDATIVGKVLAKAGTAAGKGGAELEPGAYDYDFTQRFRGQAIVNQPGERTSKTMHAGLAEIVVAAFSEVPELKAIGLDTLLDKGTRACKSARRSAAGREKLGVETKALSEAVERAVIKADLYTEETKPVAGAFRCEPDITTLNCNILRKD